MAEQRTLRRPLGRGRHSRRHRRASFPGLGPARSRDRCPLHPRRLRRHVRLAQSRDHPEALRPALRCGHRRARQTQGRLLPGRGGEGTRRSCPASRISCGISMPPDSARPSARVLPATTSSSSSTCAACEPCSRMSSRWKTRLRGKPDPQVFLMGAEKLGIEPQAMRRVRGRAGRHPGGEGGRHEGGRRHVRRPSFGREAAGGRGRPRRFQSRRRQRRVGATTPRRLVTHRSISFSHLRSHSHPNSKSPSPPQKPFGDGVPCELE